MKAIIQHNYAIASLFQALYREGEFVYFAQNDGTKFHQYTLGYSEIEDWFLTNQAKPNLYFTPSVLLNKESTPDLRDSFSKQRGFCLDLDFGTEGHKVKTHFTNEAETLCYLKSLPIKPTMIWNTGHSIQALYLLDKKLDLTNQEARDEWLKICTTIKTLSYSDTLPSPEHLFRIPCTINLKEGCAPVTSNIIEFNSANITSMETLQKLHYQYGIDDLIEQKTKLYRHSARSDDIPFKDLPEEAQDIALDPGTGDRSHDFFIVVLKLNSMGYSLETIHGALLENVDFADKYGDRLEKELQRILDKISGNKAVYYSRNTDHTALVRSTEMLETHRLTECSDPDSDVVGMLKKYIAEFALASTDALQNSLKFHEHLFNKCDSGVFETGCGYGKSTWALCRIAAKAAGTEPYIYIVETLDAVRKAHSVLLNLDPNMDAGVYHGFDQQQCKSLTGKSRTWKETVKGDECICNTCAHHKACTFYGRDKALKQSAAIMTHQGFLILAEQGKINTKASVIIDEDLQTMLSADFTLKELLDIDRWTCKVTGNQYRNLGKLLPGTLMEHYIEHSVLKYDPTLNNPTYCGNHYAAFSSNTKLVKDGLSDIGMAISSAMGSVPEHVWSFYFFFRSARNLETDFILHETQDKNGTPRLHLKKNRIGLGSIKARKLWILNASASLSPNTYPDSMKIHRCVDLQPNSHRVNLYVIEANPMRSKVGDNINASNALLKAHSELKRHTKVLLTLSKQDGSGAKIIKMLKPALHHDVDIKVINRGRLKGTNEVSDRTLVVLSCMSVFTTVDNCAMELALDNKRTIPRPSIYNKHGAPRMHRGYFEVPDIQEIYACSALDELYQALYRSAIRMDQDVDVVIAIPHLEWLSALHRTVLPDFALQAAYRWKDGKLDDNPQVLGFCELLEIAEGESIKKSDIAGKLGFKGKTAWKDNKDRILFWLDPFFDAGTRELIRKKK